MNGLYAAIIPSATYLFFGSSMQLAVGPVAIVSLMVGSLVSKWQPDYLKNPEAAVDTAAQLALNCGIIMVGMSFLNLGSFINFVSHPVMSGFTTGAAMTIGMSQIRGAFGFLNNPPQLGQPGYSENFQVMEWYTENFNAKTSDGYDVKNHLATKICFGLFVPLMLLAWLKAYIKPTPERKKRWSWTIWTMINALAPFFGMILAAHATFKIKEADHFFDKNYNHDLYASKLAIVGKVPSGLDIFRTPKFRHSFGEMFADSVPLALVLFMESYAVAYRIAGQCNQLYLLNASQEVNITLINLFFFLTRTVFY